MLGWFFFIFSAYLVGSVPFGLLLGWVRGVDLRAHGSGNIGATNAGRVLGTKWGALCLILDACKGAVPTLLAGVWSGAVRDTALDGQTETLWVLVALAAILGHVFPVWLGFKGGKGVATSLGGVAAALYPIVTFLAALDSLVFWLVSLRVTRYVGVSSVVAAAALPVAVIGASMTPTWGERAVVPVLVMTAMLAVLVIWRHRGNIARTVRGEEPRVGGGTGVSDKSPGGR